MNKQFAIFDMDGTLVDSMIYWTALAKEFLSRKGITSISDEVFNTIRPMTMTESSTFFIKEFNLSGTVESVIEEQNQIMTGHYLNDIDLKNGVREYLEILRGRNVRMCVASATPKPLIEACLKRLSVLDYFEFIMSCEEVGSGKSKPDVYYACAKRFNVNVQDIAVYEDTIFAGTTAKKADFYLIGVYDDAAGDSWKDIVELADETIIDWADSCRNL